MNRPKVSIIVPVYNVEKYLIRCLDSLVSQSFNDIEIIAINDGSIDNSYEILKEYSKSDSRIKVINKKNEGLSQTRNLGIEISKGQYITFVDSDDWIDNLFIEKLYKRISEGSNDIAICSYIREYENRSLPKVLDIPNECLDNSVLASRYIYRRIIGPIGNELSRPENLDSLVTACCKMYDKSILKNNDIRFVDTKLIGTEDCLFNIYALKKSTRVGIVNEALYHYWKGNSSSLTTGYKEKLNILWKRNQELIKKYLDENNEDKLYYLALNNRICLSTLGLGLNECSKANKNSIINKILNIKSILNEERIVNAFDTLEFSKLPTHWKVFYSLNKWKIASMSYIMLNIINLLRRFK